jgi:hypothetical protein
MTAAWAARGNPRMSDGTFILAGTTKNYLRKDVPEVKKMLPTFYI